jgi:hypothetical protein
VSEEQAALSNTERDFIIGRNVPRPTNIISGGQWTNSSTEVRGKRPTVGPPIQIGVSSPYISADSDDEWKQTFGGSLDNTFAIINGVFVQTSIDDIELAGIWKDGTTNAEADNIWRLAGDVQQVQYIVSQDTVIGASVSTAWAGAVNEMRGFGIRIPSLAGGWGRTIDGLPTDPDPENPRKNDDEHKLARETWKYGPLGPRWDYRTNTWSMWNEMIADHEDKDLGTWIFSTNSDTDEGYPFLRARLQDVWWVRKTHTLEDVNGTEEGVQSAELMTHLRHKLFDEEENGAGKLNTVFIIPHENGTHDDTHERTTDEAILGGETTGDSFEDRIDIRTTVHFWKEAGTDGPIKFGSKASNVSLCCKPSQGKFITGEMIFMDEVQDFCVNSGPIGGGGVITVTGSPSEPEYKWVPAIKVDECALMGDHVLKMLSNDARLGLRISDVCNSISAWTGGATRTINRNFGEVNNTIDCLNDELAGLAQSATKLIGEVSFQAIIRDQRVVQATQNAINLLVDNINAMVQTISNTLVACGCSAIETTVSKPLILIEFPGPVIVTNNGGLKTEECVLLYQSVADYPCDNCFGTLIELPCMTSDQIMAGTACAGSNPVGSIQLANPTTCGAN